MQLSCKAAETWSCVEPPGFSGRDPVEDGRTRGREEKRKKKKEKKLLPTSFEKVPSATR